MSSNTVTPLDGIVAPEAGTNKGILYVVGIGPGAEGHTTPDALAAIQDAELVVGYSTYIKLVSHLLSGKQVVRTGMTEEIGRARTAVEHARDGAKVALVSSGDAGVYGMAGLVFQVLKEVMIKGKIKQHNRRIHDGYQHRHGKSRSHSMKETKVAVVKLAMFS